jgi:hypothetical protein
MSWRMDKSSSLGMPMSPQEISKRYKRQSLGDAPEAPLLHQQKSGHLSTHYIFIASCTMRLSWSVSCFRFQFSFCFVCCNKCLDHIMFVLERDLLRFSFAKNTLVFTLIVQRVFSFSRTAFSLHFLPWFCSGIVISLHQGVFGLLVYVGFHQKSCFKKVRMVLEKRNFHAKKWYKKELV